jgi:16S rRNA (guanine1207-N2)-methyltransferase
VNADPEHARLVEVELAGAGSLLSSPAVRGFPAAAPGLAELLAAVPELSGRVADVTASAGGGVLAARGAERIVVLEPSFAALRAARRRFGSDDRVSAEAGLPWDLPAGGFDTALALPPAERGNDRVRAELAALASALAPDGCVYLAMHKDQGAKRYERDALTWFGSVEVLARSRGWRVSRLAGPLDAASGTPQGRPGPAGAEPWRRFEALGTGWWALPGVFAARGLDAGSAQLVTALGELGVAPLAAADVLDLGCGTGLLAAAALRAGAAAVTAVDDDLAAVRSSRRNLQAATARVLHSDLDAALEAATRFDVVIANPPFHLGRQVRLALSRAFVEAAHRRLERAGTLLMVANRALPYERELEGWARYETLRDAGGFKVLRAWR